MVWLPEVDLGIGCEQGIHDGWQREWLYWYDRFGKRFPTAQERAAKAEAIAIQERQEKLQERFAKQQAEQKAQRLAEMLRAIGINPDD